MKRGKSGGDLTGGSRDVNPQWFNMFVQQDSPDLSMAVPFPLPVQRLSQRQGRALVMEILKIFWDMPTFIPPTTQQFSFLGWISTKDPGLPTAVPIPNSYFNALRRDGTTVDYYNKTVFTGAAGATIIDESEPIIHDLTDGSGHGVLIATDNLYLNYVSAVGGSTLVGQITSVTARVLYRWKEVDLTEYIGIVQSQQQ